MLFSYNWLQSFFNRKLPEPKKLAELLNIHSFEVKELKRLKKDFVLDLDILPNRGPDCFSHLGIAREIAAIMNLKALPNQPRVLIREDKKLKAKDFIKIEVRNSQACPRYIARVINNVKVGPSPEWIKDRLKVCGLRPINNVVDIANYVMLETGQPLHAFDGEKLEGGKIIVRFAQEGEKIVTLDGEKYDLDEDILVIADAKKPIAIAGIKGGKIPEINKKTKIVILESANFNPRVIRVGSKKLNLKTDASWRFEHGIDPNLTELAINRAAYLIQEITGGRIAQGSIDFYPQKVLPKRVKLDLDYLDRLLGVKIPRQKIITILKSLGFKIKNLKLKIVNIEVPTFRLDISTPEDLIEEIGRIYGYEKIPSKFPTASLILPRKNLEILWEDMSKDILREAGFSEVYNYSFIGEREAKILNYEKEELIEIGNPTSVEFKYLRPSLIPNLLKNFKKNQPSAKIFGEDIRIFEIGKIFKIENSKPLEKKMLTGLMTDSFFSLKGILDSLLNKLGISQIFYDEYKATPEESKIFIWHPKKIAEIKIDGEEIGFLGEISKRILEKFEISQNLFLFDINFEKLQKYCSEEVIYQPISRYPAAIRDIAVLVPRYVRVEEVLNKVELVSPLIRDIDLFDIYEGEEIPQGKKSLAFHIIYQAEDRALLPEEIDEIQSKIIKTLEEDPEWEVRK